MEKITILHSLADQEKKQVSELVIIPDIERTKMVESMQMEMGESEKNSVVWNITHLRWRYKSGTIGLTMWSK